MAQVQIVPSVLRKQVGDGMKLVPLAEHYNLPVAQMKKALKTLNLKIRNFQEPKFVFTEELTQEVLDLEVESTYVPSPQEIQELQDFSDNRATQELIEAEESNVQLPQDASEGVTQENW